MCCVCRGIISLFKLRCHSCLGGHHKLPEMGGSESSHGRTLPDAGRLRRLGIFNSFSSLPSTQHPVPPSPHLLTVNVAFAHLPLVPSLTRRLYSICSLRSLLLRSFLSSPLSRALVLISQSRHLPFPRYACGAQPGVVKFFFLTSCMLVR